MKKKMPLEHLRKSTSIASICSMNRQDYQIFFTKTKDIPVNGMTVSIDVSLGR